MVFLDNYSITQMVILSTTVMCVLYEKQETEKDVSQSSEESSLPGQAGVGKTCRC